MNVLEMLATLGELAAAMNSGEGKGPGPVETINAFVASEKGQNIISLIDQLLGQAGLKVAIALRK